jgi:hypothetical protein
MNAISKNYKRIIINNFSIAPDDEVVEKVLEIIKQGRNSGDSYCYVTVWSKLYVRAKTNKNGSDIFNVFDRDANHDPR